MYIESNIKKCKESNILYHMNVEQLELTEWCAAAECKLRWTCKIQIILQHGRDSII